MNDDLLKLAERCEQATGPNFALELAIFSALKPREYPSVPRPYSASIDAAMTLVPEGALWLIGSEPWGKPWARCYHVERAMEQPEGYGDAVEAATPALALCAAALRALAGEKPLAKLGGE